MPTDAVSERDVELVEASRRGGRAAFGQLVERCARMVEAVSYAATRDHALGEDIAQETFLVAWRDLAQLRDPTAVRPWLCAIARGLAHKARRRRGREVSTEVAEKVASERSAFDAIAACEAEQVVRAVLARIPDVYREALVLFYYEQQSAKKVASALGITEGVVHKRLSRGRRYLAAGVEQLVEGSLRRPRAGRSLAACVLAALPLSTALAPSDAKASTARRHTWGPRVLIIGTTVVVVIGTAAWSRPTSDADSATTPVVAASALPRAPVLATSAPPPAAAVLAASAPPPPAAVAASAPPQKRAAVMPARPQPITCADAARYMVDLIAGPDGAPSSTSFAARIEDQCRAESWSQRELRCMIAADDALTADACKAPRRLPEPKLAPSGTSIHCGAVADHMLAVSPPAPQEQRHYATYPALHAQLVDICTTEAWSEMRRRCTLAARSGQMMARCIGLDAESQPSTAPDASCAAVGRQVASVMSSEVLDAASKLGSADDVADSFENRSTHVEGICSDERWPEQHRRCLLAATDPTQIASCRVATFPR